MRDDDDRDDDRDERPARRRRRECPYCGCTRHPVRREKISQAGWIVFGVVCCLFFPMCWVGLLMKDSYRECGECGEKL